MPFELNKNHKINLAIEPDKGSDINRRYAVQTLKDLSKESFKNIKHWTDTAVNATENPRVNGTSINATCTLKIHDLTMGNGATEQNLVAKFSHKSANMLRSLEKLHQACMSAKKDTPTQQISTPEQNPFIKMTNRLQSNQSIIITQETGGITYYQDTIVMADAIAKKPIYKSAIYYCAQHFINNLEELERAEAETAGQEQEAQDSTHAEETLTVKIVTEKEGLARAFKLDSPEAINTSNSFKSAFSKLQGPFELQKNHNVTTTIRRPDGSEPMISSINLQNCEEKALVFASNYFNLVAGIEENTPKESKDYSEDTLIINVSKEGGVAKIFTRHSASAIKAAHNFHNQKFKWDPELLEQLKQSL